MGIKIKILHFIRNIDRGGAETLLLNICKELIGNDNKFEFKVVVFEEKLHYLAHFEEAGVEVIRLNVMEKGPIGKIRRSYQVIKNYGPDIVHTHLLLTDRFGLIASFLAQVKTRVCTVHNMEGKRNLQDKITRIITSIFATHIVVVSKSAKEFCIKNKLYPASKMLTIYNAPGFEPTSVLPRHLNSTDQKITLVNVARLHIQKGQIYLLRAMKRLESYSKKIILNIYGEGDQEDTLRQEVENLKITNVFFKGISTNIEQVLLESEIFISSSLWEGLPLTVLEAISMGIPTIVTDIAPHREIFEDSATPQLFIKPKDVIGIVESIKTLVDNSELYHTISKENLLLSKKFSYNAMIQRYHSFYISLSEGELRKEHTL